MRNIWINCLVVYYIYWFVLGSWGYREQQGKHLYNQEKPGKCRECLLWAISERFFNIPQVSCGGIGGRRQYGSHNSGKKKRRSNQQGVCRLHLWAFGHGSQPLGLEGAYSSCPCPWLINAKVDRASDDQAIWLSFPIFKNHSCYLISSKFNEHGQISPTNGAEFLKLC